MYVKSAIQYSADVCWRTGRTNHHPEEQFPVVVKVQRCHLSSVGQRDNFQRVIDISIIADKWAGPVGLVGGQVLCEQYVFGRCKNARADME